MGSPRISAAWSVAQPRANELGAPWSRAGTNRLRGCSPAGGAAMAADAVTLALLRRSEAPAAGGRLPPPSAESSFAPFACADAAAPASAMGSPAVRPLLPPRALDDGRRGPSGGRRMNAERTDMIQPAQRSQSGVSSPYLRHHQRWRRRLFRKTPAHLASRRPTAAPTCTTQGRCSPRGGSRA